MCFVLPHRQLLVAILTGSVGRIRAEARRNLFEHKELFGKRGQRRLIATAAPDEKKFGMRFVEFLAFFQF